MTYIRFFSFFASFLKFGRLSSENPRCAPETRTTQVKFAYHNALLSKEPLIIRGGFLVLELSGFDVTNSMISEFRNFILIIFASEVPYNLALLFLLRQTFLRMK